MRLTLEITPQLGEKLARVAQARGVAVEALLTDDIEARYSLPGDLVFTSLGIGESELSGRDSEAWLEERWNRAL